MGYGGRYDNLLSNYNGNHPATGFAFDLLAIYDYITKTTEIKNEKDFYIIDTTEDKKLAYNIAKNLRTKGYTVARDIIKRDIDLSIDFAFKNGYKNVILITVENSGKKVYILKDKNKKEEASLEEILK
jgi:Histidyl-tRNA synthetase